MNVATSNFSLLSTREICFQDPWDVFFNNLSKRPTLPASQTTKSDKGKEPQHKNWYSSSTKAPGQASQNLHPGWKDEQGSSEEEESKQESSYSRTPYSGSMGSGLSVTSLSSGEGESENVLGDTARLARAASTSVPSLQWEEEEDVEEEVEISRVKEEKIHFHRSGGRMETIQIIRTTSRKVTPEELETIVSRLVRPLDKKAHSKAVKELLRIERDHFKRPKARSSREVARIVERLHKAGLRAASVDSDVYHEPVRSIQGLLRQYKPTPPSKTRRRKDRKRDSFPPINPTQRRKSQAIVSTNHIDINTPYL